MKYAGFNFRLELLRSGKKVIGFSLLGSRDTQSYRHDIPCSEVQGKRFRGDLPTLYIKRCEGAVLEFYKSYIQWFWKRDWERHYEPKFMVNTARGDCSRVEFCAWVNTFIRRHQRELLSD